jgi:hypothetical protein
MHERSKPGVGDKPPVVLVRDGSNRYCRTDPFAQPASLTLKWIYFRYAVIVQMNSIEPALFHALHTSGAQLRVDQGFAAAVEGVLLPDLRMEDQVKVGCIHIVIAIDRISDHRGDGRRDGCFTGTALSTEDGNLPHNT